MPKATPEQQRVIDWVASGQGNGLVSSVAGSGKSTLITQCANQITPFALNIAMDGAADAPKRERLGRSSLEALGVLPTPPRGPVLAP